MSPLISRRDAVRDVALSVVLSIVTCGFWNLYWNYWEMRTMNGLLGREEFQFWLWLVLTVVTCGIYHLYYEYQVGRALVEVQRKYALVEDTNLPIICLLVSLLGLSIVADAIQQNEINKVYERAALPA